MDATQRGGEFGRVAFSASVNVLFRVPDRLAEPVGRLAHGRRQRHTGQAVIAEDGDGVGEFLVRIELRDPIPHPPVTGIVERVDAHVVQAGVIQRLAKLRHPRRDRATLVPTPNRIQVQAVIGFQPLGPFHVVIAHVRRPELAVANPARATPRAGVEGEGGIAPSASAMSHHS